MYNPFRLGPSHSLYFMEEFIENGIGLSTPEHDEEHNKMYEAWGMYYPNSMPMNGKPKFKTLEDGSIQYSYGNDRAWHLALHVKYYKQVGMHPEIVKKYEEEVGSLDDVELPIIDPNDPKGKR